MNYKTLILCVILLALTCLSSVCQTVVVTDDPEYIEGASSAVLDVNSEHAGFLMPRMTGSQRDAIAGPANGLLIFQTDDRSGFYYNAGSPEEPNWIMLSSDSAMMEVLANAGVVWDVDGNRYPTVLIGNIRWMAGNLRVTHFRNGETIPKVESASVWSTAGLAAYSEYDNMSANSESFGLLYNGIAVQHPSGICPEGWQVPDENHWQQLADYLGGSDTVGRALKAARYWGGVPENALNSSGFSAIPSGFRSGDNGYFAGLRAIAGWWSFSETSQPAHSIFQLHADGDTLSHDEVQINGGYAVRCIMEIH